MKKSLPAVYVIFAVSIAAAACWLFIFARRSILFWGAAPALSAALAVIFALLCAAAICLRPIPVKVSAVAVLYLLIFSVISETAGAVLRAAAPGSAVLAAVDSGVPVLVITVLLLAYGWVHGKKTVLKRYGIVSARFPEGMKLRVALVSDVHMGFSVDEARLSEQCARISKESPDILVITGDLVDDQTAPEQMAAACRLLGAITTTCGAYFIYGNHDLAQRGPKLRFSRGQYEDALRENGINILADTCLEAGGALIAGRLDAGLTVRSGRKTIKELLNGADMAKPVILLDHQPLEVKEAARLGVALMLSGHTHGGQVWPVGLLSQLASKGLCYGDHVVDGMHIIITSGLGNRGNRLRSGCTAETVIIDITGTGK